MHSDPEGLGVTSWTIGGTVIAIVLTAISILSVTSQAFDSSQYSTGRVSTTAESCNSNGIFPSSCKYVVVVDGQGYSASFEQYAALPRGALACVTVKGLTRGSVADASRCKVRTAR